MGLQSPVDASSPTPALLTCFDCLLDIYAADRNKSICKSCYPLAYIPLARGRRFSLLNSNHLGPDASISANTP